MIINVDKFVASLMRHYYDTYNVDKRVCKCWLDDVLEDQGLEYKDGEIVKTQRRIAAEAKEAIFDNEDEKIRKRLLMDFSILGKEEWGGLKVKDICAWLERQGKQKPPVIDFKAKNWYVSKVDGKIHDLTYNPTDKKELKKLSQPVTKINEQVWSEEDEDMAGRIRDALKGTRYNYYYKDSIEMIDWLKSIKQRLGGK